MSHPRITIDPKIMFGKPVIAGTRIPVETILELLARGMTPQELVDGFPGLVTDDIAAALRFATDHLPGRVTAEAAE
jgi:uncharacterized protein (DUF433 family)